MSRAEEEAAEKTYRAIGRFIFEFSQVEYTIRHHLAEEIELKEEYFSAIVQSYDAHLFATVATEIFKRSRGGNSTRICELLKEFVDKNTERNRIAHGLWVPFREGGTVHDVSRKKFAPRQFTEQAKKIEALADDLCRLRADLERAFYYSVASI